MIRLTESDVEARMGRVAANVFVELGVAVDVLREQFHRFGTEPTIVLSLGSRPPGVRFDIRWTRGVGVLRMPWHVVFEPSFEAIVTMQRTVFGSLGELIAERAWQRVSEFETPAVEAG